LGSWEDQLDKLLTKEELREVVPVEQALFEELHVELDHEGRGQCPFHDDSRPSFAVFEANEGGFDRAGCWSCDWRGDIYDVVQVARECSFTEAVRVVRSMLDRLGEVRRREASSRPQVALTELHARTRRAVAEARRDPTPLANFIRAKGLPFDPNYLVNWWSVGVDSRVGIGAILIPHLDFQWQTRAYKVRTPYTPTIAARGSRFDHLYGSHLLAGWPTSGTILLVEGESDAWFSQSILPETRVLALPTGAQSPLRGEWLSLLGVYDDVRLCFDADQAGRQATRRWQEGLPTAGVVELPEGRDCVETGVGELRRRVLAG
jgi:hypothetical protein